MAGEAYPKRWPAGFVDNDTSKYADAQFLNNVEAALLRLLGADPIDQGVQVWDAALGRMKSIKLTNSQIDPAAAIDKSKLAALNIVDADVSASAAIAKSKLNLAGGIGNADMASGAPIKRLFDSALSGSQATFDITGIDAGFAHLRLFVYARTDSASTTNDSLQMRLNNDSGANYQASERVEGVGAAASAVASSSAQTSMLALGLAAGGASTASVFAISDILIPNYAGTVGHKSAICNSFLDVAAQSLIRTSSGRWASTAAINRITLLLSTGNFVSGSRCTLYGWG